MGRRKRKKSGNPLTAKKNLPQHGKIKRKQAGKLRLWWSKRTKFQKIILVTFSITLMLFLTGSLPYLLLGIAYFFAAIALALTFLAQY